MKRIRLVLRWPRLSAYTAALVGARINHALLAGRTAARCLSTHWQAPKHGGTRGGNVRWRSREPRRRWGVAASRPPRLAGCWASGLGWWTGVER